MKKCKDCKLEFKNIKENFYKHGTGYRSRCKKCHNKYREKRFKINRIKEYGSWENYLKSKKYKEKQKRKYLKRRENHLKRYYVDKQYTEKIKKRNREKHYKNPWKTAMRSMFKNFMERKSYKKSKSTHIHLGYNWQTFKQRIEMNFKEGMSWDNYGEWHIDHKKPLSRFKKDTPPNICNALCNLQPLWEFENLSKNNKF